MAVLEHEGSGWEKNYGVGHAIHPAGDPGAELLTKGFAAEDDKRKADIEVSVREIDAIAKKMRAETEKLQKADVMEFEDLRKAHGNLKELRAEFEAKRKAVEFDLQNVRDADFRSLISFHFQRLKG